MAFDPKASAAAVQRNLAAAVADKVAAGLRLAAMQAFLGADGFARWCPERCGLPLAEAELLLRWAQKRPQWADPAAVDLSDPLAVQLLELGATRHHQPEPG
jgi:hypothetical protein